MSNASAPSAQGATWRLEDGCSDVGIVCKDVWPQPTAPRCSVVNRTKHTNSAGQNVSRQADFSITPFPTRGAGENSRATSSP